EDVGGSGIEWMSARGLGEAKGTEAQPGGRAGEELERGFDHAGKVDCEAPEDGRLHQVGRIDLARGRGIGDQVTEVLKHRPPADGAGDLARSAGDLLGVATAALGPERRSEHSLQLAKMFPHGRSMNGERKPS